MAVRIQTELMICRTRFIRRTKETATPQHAMETPEDTIQNVGMHG